MRSKSNYAPDPLKSTVRVISISNRQPPSFPSRQVVFGMTKEIETWRQCVGFVNSNMDEAVGRLYVERAFSEKSKEMVSRWRAVWTSERSSSVANLNHYPRMFLHFPLLRMVVHLEFQFGTRLWHMISIKHSRIYLTLIRTSICIWSLV